MVREDAVERERRRDQLAKLCAPALPIPLPADRLGWLCTEVERVSRPFKDGSVYTNPRSLGDTFRTWRDSLAVLDPTQSFLVADDATYSYFGVILLGASAWKEVTGAWAKTHAQRISSWVDFEAAINAVHGLSATEAKARLLAMMP